MNYVFIFIFFLVSCQIFAADSTIVQPPQVKIPINNKVTVNVLHYNSNVQLQYANPACPPDSPLIFSDFFPSITNQTNFYYSLGHFFYNCLETYRTDDPYYIKLLNNAWTICNNNTFYNCSIKMRKPPIIRFIAKIPNDGIETNGTKLTFFQVDLYMDNGNTAVGSTAKKINLGDVVYTWVYNNPYYPYPTGFLTIYWRLKGRNTETGAQAPVWNTNNTNVWGDWECSAQFPSDIGFALTVSPAMMGQTCILTCDGRWSLKTGPRYTWQSTFGTATCQ